MKTKVHRNSRAIGRASTLIVAASLVATACAGSDSNDDSSAPGSLARQEITEADAPEQALVAATSTTSTTTTTTTTTTTVTTVRAPPATTTAPSTGSDTNPASTGDEVAFSDGVTLSVGTEVMPGLYMAVPSQRFCTWDRVTSENEEVGSISQGQVLVQILATDTSFTSDTDCGTWEPYEAPSTPATVIGEGHWVVGEQIQPGTYRTDRTSFDFCYWERAEAFLHTTDEIIVNTIVMEQETVTIQASDVRFVSSGCGNWTLVE